MWQPPKDGYFQVAPLKPSDPWRLPEPRTAVVEEPLDDNKKQEYGIALAKQDCEGLQAAFKAACEIFGDNTQRALWVSNHWPRDPVVIAAKDMYEKTVKSVRPLLDKEQLAAKLLSLAEEKIERNGQFYYTNEAKDRIAALKTYAEIAGYIGKIAVDASTNNFVNNEMKVTLVKPSEEPKVIEHRVSEQDLDNEFENDYPLTIKLVS